MFQDVHDFFSSSRFQWPELRPSPVVQGVLSLQLRGAPLFGSAQLGNLLVDQRMAQASVVLSNRFDAVAHDYAAAQRLGRLGLARDRRDGCEAMHQM